MTTDQNNALEPLTLKPELQPTPTQSTSEMHTLTPQFEQLLNEYLVGINATKKVVTPIHVDEIASRVAKFYEMIRKVVDWKEDNVLLRSAIERALKRTLFPKLSGVTLAPVDDIYRLAFTITSDLIR